MKTERITSNRGRHHYKLTPTELIELPLKGYGGYILPVTEMKRVGLPRHNGTTPIPEVTCIHSNNNIGCGFFPYYLDAEGRLRIGCREFNKATTKKLLRWAGLL